MDTKKLLVKIGKKFRKKLGCWVTKNPNQNFRILEIFRFGYGSPFYRPEISSTRTEIFFGLDTRTMSIPRERLYS